MPEGDIAKRVSRRLTQALDTGVLIRTDLRWADLGGSDLRGQRALETVSYGKHILTRTDAGWTLHSHLRMDGMWQIRRTTSPAQRLARPSIRAVLATESWTCFGDRLGELDLVRTRDERRLIGHLGPDLLTEDPDIALAAANAAKRATETIGSVLLDQQVAAGIGTIYMAESLWHHRINPWRPTGQVDDLAELFTTASTLMHRSADARLPTATGQFERGRTTYVHGRGQLPCRRCGALIVEKEVGRAPMQRPAFFCPVCQPS